LRRGVAALKAENRQLRAEIANLRTPLQTRHAAADEFGELATIVLPAGSGAPGAARQVIAHCLLRLVTPEILQETQLLASELVTNSVRHGDLSERDTVLVRISLASDCLRLEIENPGTAGVVASNGSAPRAGRGYGLQIVDRVATRWGVSRGQSTSVWFEMAPRLTHPRALAERDDLELTMR
jgi:anti-sigma regulatory factor (Ser/Thr protein kinase)